MTTPSTASTVCPLCQPCSSSPLLRLLPGLTTIHAGSPGSDGRSNEDATQASPKASESVHSASQLTLAPLAQEEGMEGPVQEEGMEGPGTQCCPACVCRGAQAGRAILVGLASELQGLRVQAGRWRPWFFVCAHIIELVSQVTNDVGRQLILLGH
eukprot:1144747-Pelagomonas_calceolata.AAC.6